MVVDVRLDSYEWGLEEGAGADASYYLVDCYLVPAAGPIEVYYEAGS